MIGLIRFISRHPLTRGNVPAALGRFARYQLLTRTRREVTLPWIEGTKLVVRTHTPGASGNIYAGLHEYPDMGFLIHFLRPNDLFVDVGANVGSWTVLASGLCRARTVAVEADPRTAEFLRRNIEANGIGELVSVETVAVGDRDGFIRFTVGRDTMNRIAEAGDASVQEVPVRRLDALLSDVPTFLKLDVEGHEEAVIRGAAGFLHERKLMAVSTELCSPGVEAALTQAGLRRAWYDPDARCLTTAPNGLAANNSLFVRDLDEARARIATAPRRSVVGKML
jgi:FkbM family methyltransferase